MKQITSLQHPLVKHFVKLRHNRDYREEHGTVLIDGFKMVSEVCHAPHCVLVLDETLIPPGISSKETLIVSEEILRKITGLPTPEGIVAEVPRPSNVRLKGKKLLALDGLSDPGNLGTLLRTALALGWEGVFLFNDCCDPYNDKALRSAKGATFKLPLCIGTWQELQAFAQEEALPFIAADLEGVPLSQVDPSEKWILILGNEAHGLSEESKKFCQRITIPQKEGVESLNVAAAGAILMYTLARNER